MTRAIEDATVAAREASVSWLRHVSVKTRCLACFAVVLALLAMTVAVSLVAASSETAAAAALRQDDATDAGG